MIPSLNTRPHAGAYVSTLLLVPAWNEADSLPTLLDELIWQYPEYDILVVDDGSCDGTSAVSRRCDVRVVQHPYNLGIGGAEQTGFLFAQRYRYDFVVRLDGDGQHPSEAIRGLLCALEESGADVVIGSRFLQPNPGFHSSWARRVGIRWLALLNTILAHQRITDSTSGFRAYRRNAFQFLARHNPQDYPEPESLTLLSRNGFRIKETPVEMRERQGGKSSIGGLHSLYYVLKTTLALLIATIRKPVRTGASDGDCI
jgi:glycosyltransferase involved in cell wall biosynthesis